MTTEETEIVVLAHRDRPVSAPAVRALFDEEGWWPERDEATLARLLDAGPAVGAWRGVMLVGFARAVTDGLCRGYLEDVVVRRDCRGSGVGQLLVSVLEENLPEAMTVTAFFEPRRRAFYERLGYRATHQTVGHHLSPSAEGRWNHVTSAH